MKHGVTVLAALLLILPLSFSLSVAAASTDKEDRDILREVEEAIPPSVRDRLPSGLVQELEKGEDADPVRLAEAMDRQSLTELLKKAGRAAISPFLEALGGCIGLTIVAAILSAFGKLCGDGGRSMQWLLSLCTVLSLWRIGQGSFQLMTEALNTVSVFIRALLPTVAAVYAAGGNFTAAAAEEGALLLLLEWMETFCGSVLQPMLKVVFTLAAAAHVCGEEQLRGLSGAVCKAITLILSFLMTVLSTVLGYQHSIASGADGVLLRSVKFAASGVVPVLGGSMSEAMGTAVGAVGFLRSAVGSVATAVILIILLFPCMHLLGTRAAIGVSAMMAKLVGCSSEGAIFSEIGGIYDLAMAVLTIFFFSLLFAMTLMVRCAVAAG